MAFKIYTKTGDQGETSLFGGKRLPKHHLRIEAYGTVDELNANLGLLRDYIETDPLRSELKGIQDILFTIGSMLATDPESIPYEQRTTNNEQRTTNNEQRTEQPLPICYPVQV
jgi:cob(I)alamin adenosyltransferase